VAHGTVSLRHRGERPEVSAPVGPTTSSRRNSMAEVLAEGYNVFDTSKSPSGRRDQLVEAISLARRSVKTSVGVR